MWVGSKNECLFNNVFNLQILTPSEYFRRFFFLSIEIFENKDFAFEYMNIYVLNNNFKKFFLSMWYGKTEMIFFLI